MADTASTPSQTAPPSPTNTPRPASGSALAIIFLVVFIDLFGFGIVLPLLPRYGKEFLAGTPYEPWGGPILGALVACFSLMQFIFAPVWGRVSDRVGRRPILLIGLFSSVVFYTVFGIASTFGREGYRELGLLLLFVSRVGAGIAGATLGTAQAAIADSTPGEGRSRGMALIGAAFGIGFFFGPILGFLAKAVAPDAKEGPGYLAAALSLVAFVLGVVLLPETRRPGAVSHARRRWFDRQGFRTALRAPAVGLLILTFFLSTLGFANFEPTLALLTAADSTTRNPLALSDKYNFLLFAYVGLVLGLAQGALYRPLARRVGEITFMIAGSVLMAVGLAGVGVVAALASRPDAPSLGTLLAALLVALAVPITGFAFITPSVQALISRLSDPNRQGEILGVNQSASAMARILGPAVGVPLFLGTPAQAGPFVLGTSLALVVLLLSVYLRQGPAGALGPEKSHATDGERPVE
jgi:MFS family permease